MQIKDLANYKQDVYVKAFAVLPENRNERTPSVFETSLGKGFGGSLADVTVFTALDEDGITEILKVTVEAR